MKKEFDLSSYFVVGPENTQGRDPLKIIQGAVEAGFGFIQIRSKEASARDLIDLSLETSKLLEQMGKDQEVSLVLNDRLDIALAARDLGAKIDGIHVGQGDIPVEICRKYLGEGAIIGLSARTDQLIEYVKTVDVSAIDYFGAGPLHETQTKPDCGLNDEGRVVVRSLEELRTLAQVSPLPIVVGGGVKREDLKELARTGVDGFFVVSAIASAKDPKRAARELVETWKESVMQ